MKFVSGKKCKFGQDKTMEKNDDEDEEIAKQNKLKESGYSQSYAIDLPEKFLVHFLGIYKS
jgi:hypothetical protein